MPENQAPLTDDELLSTDIGKLSEEDVDLANKRLVAAKNQEAVKKARRESGQLVRADVVVRSMKRIG